ncbi:MAG: iron chelate uptake ABC transporter family permease subunit [Opitutae bacterium]|nr:iron chelate uptake ABC transporter family permease subunit [Opitutae bacterium]
MDAAQVADGSDLVSKTLRFFSFSDHSVQVVVLGVIFMGVGCGLMGGFVVTRKLSLFGDTLSHAVLPGVAVGFLWSQSKNSISIVVGAMIAGFLGVLLISLIKKSTKVGLDSALGLVLSGFYAVGICLLTRIQKLEFGNQSGIDRYLFGQITGLSAADVWSMGISCLLIALITTIFYKEILVTGFDPGFAHSIGLPVDLLQYLLWMLLAFSVITSLQVVGVILVSALLIIPAATASIITQKMKALLIWSASLGMIAGVTGSYISFLGSRLPTGPLIVLSSTLLFVTVLFLHYENGLFIQWIRLRGKDRKIALENTLKAVYQELEADNFFHDTVKLGNLAKRRRISMPEMYQESVHLVRKDFAFLLRGENQTLPSDNTLSLTPTGWSEACRIVRNHRLWELYLTNEVQYPADHVHEDAEKIEHVLGDETVRKIERILSNPRKDPHGKLIPSQQDIEQGYIDRRIAKSLP